MKLNVVKSFAPLTIAAVILWATFAIPPISYASIAPFQAKDFCKNGATNCVKEDKSGRSGSISCPAGQTISNVYVHAGDGQTVYQLPHDGFDVTYSNAGQTATVTVTTHQHDLSWLGVSCTTQPTNTPTNSVTPTDVSPTPTDVDPTPTDVSPTPTVTSNCEDENNCVIIDCEDEVDCEVVISPTPTVTTTSTTTPTPTTEDKKSDDNPSSGSVGGASSSSNGEVLAATTFAPTGVFTQMLSNAMLVIGSIFMTLSTLYAKAKK